MDAVWNDFLNIWERRTENLHGLPRKNNYLYANIGNLSAR